MYGFDTCLFAALVGEFFGPRPVLHGPRSQSSTDWRRVWADFSDTKDK
jgi:hypothetical protein